MARSFAGSTDVLYAGLAIVTSYPFTIGCWFKIASAADGINHALFGLFGGTTSHQGAYMEVDDRSVNYFRLSMDVTDNSNWVQTRSPNLFDEGLWNSGIVIFTDATTRKVKLNNGSFQSDNTSRSPSVYETVIGAYRGPTGGIADNNLHTIAHCAIWDVALSDDDAFLFLNGRNPVTINQEHLKGYWPLTSNQSPEPDSSTGNHPMTVSGTTYSSSNPVITEPPKPDSLLVLF